MSTISRSCTHIALALVLAAITSGCDARQRMLDAVVRQSGDLPCFSVEREGLEPNEELTVAGLQVSELDQLDRAISAPWTAGFINTSTPPPLSPDTCIPYGAPSVEHSGAPAELLLPGRHYTVSINAHVQRRGEWHNRSYGGYFCLVRSAEKGIEVRQVRWDDDIGERRWDVCRRQNLRRHQAPKRSATLPDNGH